MPKKNVGFSSSQIYGVLPAATLFIGVYSKMASLLERKALFYATCVPFFVFFFVFDALIYPNRQSIQPALSTVRSVLGLVASSSIDGGGGRRVRDIRQVACQLDVVRVLRHRGGILIRVRGHTLLAVRERRRVRRSGPEILPPLRPDEWRGPHRRGAVRSEVREPIERLRRELEEGDEIDHFLGCHDMFVLRLEQRLHRADRGEGRGGGGRERRRRGGRVRCVTGGAMYAREGEEEEEGEDDDGRVRSVPRVVGIPEVDRHARSGIR